ncbi:hypothetical protein, partial [Craurococcus roseus]|uniref:hypothetical protein n=1 Tax=Craurococcus roseus TaxID=77585 RepID=UPI0031CFC3B4
PKADPSAPGQARVSTEQVPAEWHGSVWDDLGLSVALYADTLTPVPEHVAREEQLRLDLVRVSVRWEDWDRLSAWAHDALTWPEPSSDAGDQGANSTFAGLRRYRAPRDSRAAGLFVPAKALDPSSSQEIGPELILLNVPTPGLPDPPRPGEVRLVELQPASGRTGGEVPHAAYCEFFVPFRHLCMVLTFDARHLDRWREMRDAALAAVNSTVVDRSNTSRR